MSVPQLDATDRDILSLDKGICWWDHDTRCTLVVSQPSSEPDLWREYLRGALRSYRKHGVERVLDLDTIRSGADTALFFAAVDDDGTVVGGVRAKGPYRSAEESHAVVEWAGCPGLDAVRKMIADRIPFGVVEMKTAWVERRSRAETHAHQDTCPHGVPDDGAVGRPVLDGDGSNPRSGVLAFVGRCGGIEDSGRTLSECPLPDQDDVVGPPHVRQSR